MNDPLNQLDPLEDSLRELADAERAELFRRTSVDARALVQSTGGLTRMTRRGLALRWLSIAAVLTMAATICAWIFIGGATGSRRSLLPSGTMTASATSGCDGTFFGCLTGPDGKIMPGCDSFDYNADGHIDLLDASAHQRNCNGITR